MVMPLAGGWLLSATGSFPALFALAAAGPLGGLALTARMPELRQGKREVGGLDGRQRGTRANPSGD